MQCCPSGLGRASRQVGSGQFQTTRIQRGRSAVSSPTNRLANSKAPNGVLVNALCLQPDSSNGNGGLEVPGSCRSSVSFRELFYGGARRDGEANPRHGVLMGVASGLAILRNCAIVK